MLNLLFNPSVIYISLALIVAVVLTILCMKYEVARWLVFIVITLVLFGTSVYSCKKLNDYYSAEGGVKGVLSTYFNGADGLIDNKTDKDVSITINKATFKGTNNTDEYISVLVLDELLTLDGEKDYTLLVNGTPVNSLIQTSKSYIGGKYSYNFYSVGDSVFNDVLSVDLSFYDKVTRVVLTTRGGTTAVENWNSYFEKTSLKIEVIESDFVLKDEIFVSEETYKAEEYYTWGFNYTDAMFNGYYTEVTSEGTKKNPILTFGWHEGYIDPSNKYEYVDSYYNLEWVGGIVGSRVYEEGITYKILDNTTLQITNVTNHYDYLTTKYFKLNYVDGVYQLTDTIDGFILYRSDFEPSDTIVVE